MFAPKLTPSQAHPRRLTNRQLPHPLPPPHLPIHPPTPQPTTLPHHHPAPPTLGLFTNSHHNTTHPQLFPALLHYENRLIYEELPWAMADTAMQLLGLVGIFGGSVRAYEMSHERSEASGLSDAVVEARRMDDIAAEWGGEFLAV